MQPRDVIDGSGGSGSWSRYIGDPVRREQTGYVGRLDIGKLVGDCESVQGENVR